MEYKYVLLKSSWGIVVFLDMEEETLDEIGKHDIKISNKVSLRVEKGGRLNHEMVQYWASRALTDLAEIISSILGDKNICYVIKSVDVNFADFQEEGLYCAVRGWVSKYYDIEIPEVEVFYDEQKNKYIFPTLSNNG